VADKVRCPKCNQLGYATDPACMNCGAKLAPAAGARTESPQSRGLRSREDAPEPTAAASRPGRSRTTGRTREKGLPWAAIAKPLLVLAVVGLLGVLVLKAGPMLRLREPGVLSQFRGLPPLGLYDEVWISQNSPHFHRPQCPRVGGPSVQRAQRADMDEGGIPMKTPCPACDPGPPPKTY